MKMVIIGPVNEEIRQQMLKVVDKDVEIKFISDNSQEDGEEAKNGLREEDLAAEELKEAEVLLRWEASLDTYTRVSAAMPRLRWVHTVSAGVNQLLKPLENRPEITLTNSRGMHAIPIAEWVILYMLSAIKQFPHFLEEQKKSHWEKEIPLEELTGKVVMLLGYGGIGQEIARRVLPFGVRLWVMRRQENSKEAESSGVERWFTPDTQGEWKKALVEVDFLVMAIPLTEKTKGIIDQEALQTLKKGAWVINIARGQLIEEEALYEALKEGRLGGAALDVFTQEPLPGENPLWTLPNVVLTPHISWSSPFTRKRVVAFFLENLQRWRKGEQLKNIVDPLEGY